MIPAARLNAILGPAAPRETPKSPPSPPRKTKPLPPELVAALGALGIDRVVFDRNEYGNLYRMADDVRDRERVAVYLRKRRLSYPRIGRVMGMSHSSVLEAVRRAKGPAHLPPGVVRGETNQGER